MKEKTYLRYNDFNKDELYNFFCEVDSLFPIHLSKKVDLLELAIKYNIYGMCFGIYDVTNQLVAFIAGYINNKETLHAYISLLVVKEYAQGKGYGKELLKEFINAVKDNNFKSISVYTHKSNLRALKVYMSMGFEIFEGDLNRKDDIFLVKEL